MTNRTRRYQKDQIVTNVLDTALKLLIARGDPFSILVLALLAEETLEGMLKHSGQMHRSEVVSAKVMEIDGLEVIHERGEIHPMMRKEIKERLNWIFDRLKHHGDDTILDVVGFDPEFEAQESLLRAIKIYVLLFNKSSEPIERFLEWKENHLG